MKFKIKFFKAGSDVPDYILRVDPISDKSIRGEIKFTSRTLIFTFLGIHNAIRIGPYCALIKIRNSHSNILTTPKPIRIVNSGDFIYFP